MSNSSSKKSGFQDLLFYGAVAAAVYFFFIKKGNGNGPQQPVSSQKVVDISAQQAEIQEKAAAEAAKGAAEASRSELRDIDDDGELTVPVAQSSLVDMTMSGKELLGLQEGAGTVNPT